MSSPTPTSVRHATLREPGVRWHSDECEGWVRPVGVGMLLDAGASIDDPMAVRLASAVYIEQARTDEWAAKITRAALEPFHRDGVVKSLGRSEARATVVFDSRDDAVAHAEREVAAFADASQHPVSSFSEVTA